MSEINIDLVKKLREQTGVSIMQCKKALEEAGGDLEKAKIALTKKSGEIAAKKGDRELGSGVISVAQNSSETLMIELACETDFVANNEEFGEFAKKIAEKILAGEETEEIVSEMVQKFGERIEVAKQEKYSGNVGFYIHSNNKIGAMVELSENIGEKSRDLSMHIAAQNPVYVSEENISDDEKNKAKEVLEKEVADKPEQMREKILEGKLSAYFKERVLLTQEYIKNPEQKISDFLEGAEVLRFVRVGVGE